MGTKLDPGQYDCLQAALPDEPFFVVLARDPEAPSLVEVWANKRAVDVQFGRRPKEDMGKVIEARACAKKMREWRMRNDGEWRGAPSLPTFRDAIDVIVGLLSEWGKLARYGSPLAKAANERVNAANTLLERLGVKP